MDKKKIFNWSITVALAGFLFGFDTVVISGANLPIKELWNTSPIFHGVFIMSMALWGTVIGSLFGSIPCDRIGRKNTLIWIGILFFISALGSAIAWDPYSFSFFRFIGGIGVGASTVASPTYISEISNKESRGKLVALYQFNIVFGILIAYFSNYLLQGFGGDIDWRYMLGVEAIPAIFYILFVLKVPNSPRWLILFKGDDQNSSGTIVPVAFPLIAGAGTLTTILSLRAIDTFSYYEITTGIIINLAFVYFVLKTTNTIEKLLGQSGINVLRRVFGIILLAISIKLFKTGLS